MMDGDSEGRQGDHLGAEGDGADTEEAPAPSIGPEGTDAERDQAHTEPRDSLCDSREPGNERPITVTGETGNSGPGSNMATSNNGDTGQGSHDNGPTTPLTMDCWASEKGETVTEQGETFHRWGEAFTEPRETIVGQEETVTEQRETATGQGESVTNKGETTTDHEETVTEQGETSKIQREPSTKQEQAATVQDETATEHVKEGTGQGETVTGQGETITKQREAATEHGEAATEREETTTKLGDTAKEHRETVAEQKEMATEQREISTESGEAATEFGGTDNQYRETARKQGEEITGHGERCMGQGETAMEQGEASTEEGETATEHGEASKEHGETATEQRETATEQGEASTEQGEASTEQGEATTEQGEATTEEGETATEQGEASTEQGETATEQGETATEQGETATEQGETATEQGETATEQGETATEQGENAKEHEEAATEREEKVTGQGETATELEGTVNEQDETEATEQRETVTEQMEADTYHEQRATEHREAASRQNETVTGQGETVTELGDAASDYGKAVTEQGEIFTEQGETATEQEETVTEQGNSSTEKGETATQQGETVDGKRDTATNQGKSSTEQGETATQQEETVNGKRETATNQGKSSTEQGETATQQGETATEQRQTANDHGKDTYYKQEEIDDEQRETVTKKTETAVVYEQNETENEQWETATELWETAIEEGETDACTQDIHALTAQKTKRDMEDTVIQTRRETLSEDSEEWETASDDSIDRPILGVAGGVQNEETVDGGMRDVREIQETLRQGEVRGSKKLDTIIYGIQIEETVSDTIRERETAQQEMREQRAAETEDTLAMNNEDNVLQTIGATGAGTAGRVTAPEMGEQEIKGAAMITGELWDSLEPRKEKLEFADIPGEWREEGTVSGQEGGLCNLLETDTGVQGKGLPSGNVTKQSIDHGTDEIGQKYPEIIVTAIEEKESEAHSIDEASGSPQALVEPFDHGTQSNVPAELSFSFDLQDQMSGDIHRGPIYGEPNSDIDFQPNQTRTSQSSYSDVFSPTCPNVDQAEPEGYEQNEMPQLQLSGHYTDELCPYRGEKALCPDVLPRSAPYGTDPNNDGNHEISGTCEGSQGADSKVVSQTPAALGILQEAAGTVALERSKEISLESTEGFKSKKTDTYLSEHPMDKDETITDVRTAMGESEDQVMENKTQEITRQWGTSESRGAAELGSMQSDPHNQGSFQKIRIVTITPPMDTKKNTRETVSLSTYSPHLGHERGNITGSDVRETESRKKSYFYPTHISNPMLNLFGSPEQLGFYSEGLIPEGNIDMDLPGTQHGGSFGKSHCSPDTNASKKPLGLSVTPLWVTPQGIRYSDGSDKGYTIKEPQESFLVRRPTIRHKKKGTYQVTGTKKRHGTIITSTVGEQEPTRDSGNSGQPTGPSFSAINMRPASPQTRLRFRPSEAISENEQSDDTSGQENLADEEEPIKKERPARRSDSVFLREKHGQKTLDQSLAYRRKSQFYGASKVLYQEYSDEALNQAIKNQRPESPRLRRRESQDSYLRRLSMSSADSLWQDIPEIRGSVGFLSMSRDEQKLQEAKFELIMSEALYLRSLNIAVDHFQCNPDLQEVLLAQDRQWLFSRMSEVRDASSEFLFDLEDEFQRNKYNFQVCNMVINNEPNFRRVYLPYVTNQSYQERTFQRLQNDNPRFQQVLSRLESDPVCQRLGLKSFLILPFQRIIRLRLLLQNILKRSAPGSVDELQATQAHNAVEKLIRDCNESVQRMKDTEELIHLNQKIQFECKIFPLISQSRRLIKHSEVSALEMNSLSFKLKITRSVYLHLFNDCLLLSRIREGGRFLVFDYAHAADVQVERCEKRIHGNQKNIFCISLRDNAAGSPDGRRVEYFFRTDTQSQKLRWISALSPPKEELDLFKYHGLSQMLCLKSYKAKENDELSLEKADIIFVRQSSEDGWLQGVRLSDMQSGWFPLSHVQPVSRNACLRNLEEEQRLQTARAKLQLPAP